MFKSSTYFISLLLLYLLVSTASYTLDDEATLKIELTTPKAKLVSGEPVVLDVTLSNPTGKSIPYHPILPLQESGSGIKLFIQRPGEPEPSRYVPVMCATLVFGEPKYLEPGEAYSDRSVLFTDGNMTNRDDPFLIREPGIYRFHVMYSFDSYDKSEVYIIESDPLEIEAVESSEKEHAHAREIWSQIVYRTGGMPFSWDNTWSPRPDALKNLLQPLLEQDDDTIFGQYARYMLGNNSSIFGSAEHGEWEQYQRETLEDLAYDPSFPLTNDALYHLAESCFSGRTQEDFEKAIVLMDEFQERAPYSSLIRRYLTHHRE